MGMLIDGRWTEDDAWIVDGAFKRPPSVFAEDIPAETIERFVREPGRYWLIASKSCPWSHRTLLIHALKDLAAVTPLQIAHGPRVEGYPVNGGAPWPVPGAETSIVHLHQLYSLSAPDYTGRVSVPVLWDSHERRILSNESARIMRALDAASGSGFTFAPAALLEEIDALNSEIGDGLSNAVYRAGLAQRQDSYAAAVASVFSVLDRLEARLSTSRHLLGAVITEADWRLFATLVRFDAVYHTHFRCTRRRLIDYPSLWAYARDLYAWRGVAETVDMGAILEGYYLNDGDHNPHKIIAEPPEADWSARHGRERLGPALVAGRQGGRAEIDPASLQFV